MSWRTVDENVPFITTDQMREVDRAMVEDYGILLLQMMENAGRCLADLARDRFLGGDARGSRVLVLAGSGGNGGGGLACARWLHNRGADVHVWITRPASGFEGVPLRQLEVLERLGVAAEIALGPAGLPPADLVVDALIGYSLRGAAGGTSASLIRAANGHDAPVLSLDLPSGVDGTTGDVHGPTVRAVATLTLALPKVGLRCEKAREHAGELYLGDIGVPQAVYTSAPLSLEVGHIFAKDDILRLW